jgi:hypothetical protein
VLDSTDPEQVRAIEARSDPARTLYIVASKSGSTTEPNMFLAYFWDRVRALKGADAGENFVAITDPATKMEQVAREHHFRRVFINPPDIGGRYSVLSYFGLVPAALLGIDVAALLDRAERMVQNAVASVPAHHSAGLWLGAVLGEAALSGRDKLTLLTSEALRTFGYWVEQLIAESTGKLGKGIVPVEGEPAGAPERYGKDRLFVRLALAGEADPQVQPLIEVGHPVVTITLEDRYDLGGEFFIWEVATAVAGAILQIDAFDQPNVQESKDNTVRLLREYEQKGRLPMDKPAWQSDGVAIYARGAVPSLKRARKLSRALAAHLSQVRPGDYLALTAYLPRTEQSEALLRQMRVAARDKLKVATTVGFGPRFLHSTGQLHKGGPKNGVFIQITADPVADLPIPGEPITFGVLETAQALGDLQSLQARKRRAISVRLADPADLATFAAAFQEALSQLKAKPARAKTTARKAPAKKPAAKKAPARKPAAKKPVRKPATRQTPPGRRRATPARRATRG